MVRCVSDGARRALVGTLATLALLLLGGAVFGISFGACDEYRHADTARAAFCAVRGAGLWSLPLVILPAVVAVIAVLGESTARILRVTAAFAGVDVLLFATAAIVAS
jgi:hypothetical protein